MHCCIDIDTVEGDYVVVNKKVDEELEQAPIKKKIFTAENIGLHVGTFGKQLTTCTQGIDGVEFRTGIQYNLKLKKVHLR